MKKDGQAIQETRDQGREQEDKDWNERGEGGGATTVRERRNIFSPKGGGGQRTMVKGRVRVNMSTKENDKCGVAFPLHTWPSSSKAAFINHVIFSNPDSWVTVGAV